MDSISIVQAVDNIISGISSDGVIPNVNVSDGVFVTDTYGGSVRSACVLCCVLCTVCAFMQYGVVVLCGV